MRHLSLKCLLGWDHLHENKLQTVSHQLSKSDGAQRKNSERCQPNWRTVIKWCKSRARKVCEIHYGFRYALVDATASKLDFGRDTKGNNELLPIPDTNSNVSLFHGNR